MPSWSGQATAVSMDATGCRLPIERPGWTAAPTRPAACARGVSTRLHDSTRIPARRQSAPSRPNESGPGRKRRRGSEEAFLALQRELNRQAQLQLSRSQTARDGRKRTGPRQHLERSLVEAAVAGGAGQLRGLDAPVGEDGEAHHDLADHAVAFRFAGVALEAPDSLEHLSEVAVVGSRVSHRFGACAGAGRRRRRPAGIALAGRLGRDRGPCRGLRAGYARFGGIHALRRSVPSRLNVLGDLQVRGRWRGIDRVLDPCNFHRLDGVGGRGRRGDPLRGGRFRFLQRWVGERFGNGDLLGIGHSRGCRTLRGLRLGSSGALDRPCDGPDHFDRGRIRGCLGRGDGCGLGRVRRGRGGHDGFGRRQHSGFFHRRLDRRLGGHDLLELDGLNVHGPRGRLDRHCRCGRYGRDRLLDRRAGSRFGDGGHLGLRYPGALGRGARRVETADILTGNDLDSQYK